MADPAAACRGPGPARRAGPSPRPGSAHAGTLACPLPRRRPVGPGPSAAGGRGRASPAGGPHRANRRARADPAPPTDRRDPPDGGEGLRRHRVAGPVLRRRPVDHHRPGPRHGHPRPRGSRLLPGQVRARVAADGRPPQRDVAGRPHLAGHRARRHGRQAGPAVADRRDGRLLPRDLRLHGLLRCAVNDAHRPGATAGDLAQGRPPVADVRHPRPVVRRPRVGLHQRPPGPHRRRPAHPPEGPDPGSWTR